MSSELTLTINNYKNNKNLDEYLNSMEELLLKNNENLYNRFIVLVNTNECTDIKLVVQRLIDNGTIDKVIDFLIPLKNFDIHALNELLFCIEKEQSTVIVNYLFKIDEYTTEHIKGKWFEEESKIGILLQKVFKTIPLDVSVYRFETEDIKELYKDYAR